MDSNFQYAGAVNLVVGPFGWLCLRSGAVPARRFWYSAVSRRGLGDLSREMDSNLYGAFRRLLFSPGDRGAPRVSG